MKTLNHTLAALSLSLLSTLAAACGGPEVDHDDVTYGTGDADPTPSVEEPAETPMEPVPSPTATPNRKPFAPVIAVSDELVHPADEVLFDLTLEDPDGDALTSLCTAAFTHLAEEVDASDWLEKLSETQYRFVAPITEETLATVVIRCETLDASEISELTESAPITIDNEVISMEQPDWGKFTRFTLCDRAPELCGMRLVLDSLMRVRVPDFERIPAQTEGILTTLPHTDFVSTVNLAVDELSIRKAIIQDRTPSIQVIVGANADGAGYVFEMIPSISFTATKDVVTTWDWEIRPLATNALRDLASVRKAPLASGTLDRTPASVTTAVRDGLMQVTIDGTVSTPVLPASAMAAPSISMAAHAMQAEMSVSAILKP